MKWLPIRFCVVPMRRVPRVSSEGCSVLKERCGPPTLMLAALDSASYSVQPWTAATCMHSAPRRLDLDQL